MGRRRGKKEEKEKTTESSRLFPSTKGVGKIIESDQKCGDQEYLITPARNKGEGRTEMEAEGGAWIGTLLRVKGRKTKSLTKKSTSIMEEKSGDTEERLPILEAKRGRKNRGGDRGEGRREEKGRKGIKVI